MADLDLRVEQLTFYWDAHLWPRLQGLSDAEYRWSPAPEHAWDLQLSPGGELRYVDPPPEAALVPNLAWRLMHIAIGCFHTRASTFFGDGSVPAEADMFDPRHQPATSPSTADAALKFLADSYRWWVAGLSGLTAQEMAAPLGPRGGWFAQYPMSGLVLHINREVMHHGGEIGLLRDLYAAGYDVHR